MEMSRVLVQFVQDRSGSMGSAWDETLNGFKSFVNDLREKAKGTDVEYLFSLTTFDTIVENPIAIQPIGEVDPEELGKHGPRGATALYDAVGATIKATEDNPHGADKIIVVIVTDGQENSSREWSKDALHKTIDAKLSAGNWTFTYLGTQPETWDDAGKIGVGAGASATYQPQMANAAYATVACAVGKLAASPQRGTRTLLSSFVDDEDAVSAGVTKHPPAPGPAAVPPPSQPEKPTPKKGTRSRWR